MIALMDPPACLLHRDILPPAKKVQRTHRGIAVGVAFEESPNRLPGGSGGKHMRGIPSLARQRSQDVIVSAEEDEIHRVAILRALRFSGATGQGFNRAAQLGNRQIGPGRWSRFPPELRPLIVEPAAGQLKKEAIADRTPVVHHFNVDVLGAFAEVGKEKTGPPLMGRNPQPNPRPLEELIHRLVRVPGNNRWFRKAVS